MTKFYAFWTRFYRLDVVGVCAAANLWAAFAMPIKMLRPLWFAAGVSGLFAFAVLAWAMLVMRRRKRA